MKKAPQDGELEITRDSWVKEGQLSGTTLSKAMRNGENSSKIWSSFQNVLTKAERDTLLQKRKSLRIYNELIDTLNSPVSEKQQLRLANLVKKHSTFITNQLQHNLLLRNKFILSLRNCSHITPTYRTLLGQIAKTPALAKDFEALLIAYQQNLDCQAPLDHPGLRRFLVHSIEYYPVVSDTMLKYPTNFSIDIIARTLLSSKTLPLVDFKDKLKSTYWNVLNTLKRLISTFVSSTLVDTFASEPPISSQLIATLLSPQEAVKTSPVVRIPVTFNALRTITANQIKQQESVLSKQQDFDLNIGLPADLDGTPLTPINGKATYHHTLDLTLEPCVHPEDGNEDMGLEGGEPYIPTYFTRAR